jgi:RecA-family ATPase
MISLEAFLDQVSEEDIPSSFRVGNSVEDGGEKWCKLLQPHPEGGGPFGGRDNALTSFVGYLRNKRLDYQVGVEMTFYWNQKYCQPPLDECVVEEKVSRAWTDWETDGREDATPRTRQNLPKSQILTVRDLLQIARDPEKQLQWVAKDLIQRDGITIISAPSGSGKTWLVLDFCRHLTRSDDEEYGPWLGKWELPRMNCLYLDEENGERTMGLRIQKLGFAEDNTRFRSWSYTKLRLHDDRDRLEIIRVCKEHNIELIVLDSLKAFHSKDENSATEMRHVGEWLQEFVIAGLCVIVLHHDKKGGNGFDSMSEQDKTRGSGDIVAFSQTVLGLTQKGGLFYLKERKIRNAEKTEQETVYTLSPDKTRQYENGEFGVFVDVEGAKNRAEEQREQKREESLTHNISRVKKAEQHLREAGEKITVESISRVAKMSKRDVSEARKAMNTVPPERWDLADDE